MLESPSQVFAMRKLFLASLLLVACHTFSFAAEDNLPHGMFPYPLSRPGNAMMFWYMKENAPDWAGEDFIEPLLDQVAARWSDCGIQVRYLGHATYIKGAPSAGTIYWDASKAPTDVHNARYGVNPKNRVPDPFEIRLNPFTVNGYTLEERRNIIKKVIFHEVGHAMGLGHPKEACDSVMSQTVTHCKDPKNMIFEPTAQDIVQCRKVNGVGVR
jgi:hypothetical protein